MLRVAYRPDGCPCRSGSAKLPLSIPPERSISGFQASFLDPACAVIDAEFTIVCPAPSQSPDKEFAGSSAIGRFSRPVEGHRSKLGVIFCNHGRS